MINVVIGNLLEAEENIIGHQTNCQGVMGSGIAKQIRDKYPNVYDMYIDFCSDKRPRELLGKCQFAPIGEPDGNFFVSKYIANLFGQLNYGRTKQRYTDYDALRAALTRLREVAEYYKFSVALPWNIGCGFANGDWDIVSRIIDEVFDGYEVTLYRLEE